MPGLTMQPLKLEDLTAQFDSIVRRYRDGGLIAYRDALRPPRTQPAENILAVAVQESPCHERRTGKNLVSSAVAAL